jgi:hypothetical protein
MENIRPRPSVEEQFQILSRGTEETPDTFRILVTIIMAILFHITTSAQCADLEKRIQL